jgi:hypothetical protein
VLHGVGDLRAQRATIKIIGAMRGQLLVSLCQVRVLQRRTDGQRLAVGSQEQLAATGERLQVGQRDLFFLHEIGRDREAAPGDIDRRLQVVSEAALAVPLRRGRPSGDHARHAHRQPGVASLFERQRLTGRQVDEQLPGARALGSSRSHEGVPSIGSTANRIPVRCRPAPVRRNSIGAWSFSPSR